jgi:hypothetical protein
MAGFVWVYALVWAFLTDFVKRLAYRVLDREPVRIDPRKAYAGAVFTRGAADPAAVRRSLSIGKHRSAFGQNAQGRLQKSAATGDVSGGVLPI